VIEVRKTSLFEKWFTGLRDNDARWRIQARIDRAEFGNTGDVKAVGEGVLEMRIHYGSGYRIYFVQRGNELIILLVGGDKGSQEKDIKKAQQLARDL